MGDRFSPANSFRAAVVRGERPSLVVTEKSPRLDGSGDVVGAIVPRSETRRHDHRDGSRHRLGEESAKLRFGELSQSVEVINLSDGGAMIRTDAAIPLWAKVELRFNDEFAIEGVVRWIKADQIGVEFAHETMIDCDSDTLAKLLLDVIQKSFPESSVQLDSRDEDEAEQDHSGETCEQNQREHGRHPLIWKGQILHNFSAEPVRLRNVSSGGALVDVAADYPLGCTVMLDLGESGQVDAEIVWKTGDQAGLRFRQPFDLACLARSRPEVAPEKWQRPTFLDRDRTGSSPWDKHWRRTPLSQLRSELEGYLKR